MAKKKQSISALVQQIMASPVAILIHGRTAPVKTLAARGAPGVQAVLQALSKPLPKPWKHHPHDVHDALMAVLHEVARRNPKVLVAAMDEERSHTFPIVWALQSAPAEDAIDPLLQALKHQDSNVRWAAVKGLVTFRARRAIKPLAAALKDRSSHVKETVVRAMKKSKFFRVPEAIEGLTAIVASRAMKRFSIGTWLDAKQILAEIKDK